MIGNPQVGKTSLRRSFMGETFQNNYVSTIGADFSYKSIEIGKDLARILIWDIAGQTKFSSIHPHYFRSALGALLIYDITNRESFDDLQKWVERFKELTNAENIPIIVIGNKIDLIEDGVDHITKEEQDQKIKEIQEMVPNLKILSKRTSAKTGDTVERSFMELAETISSWIKEEISVEEKEASLDDMLPAAYMITFNEIMGPLLVSSSPFVESGKYSGKTKSSTMGLMGLFDFGDVKTHEYQIGKMPWTDPPGSLLYIVFITPNPKARGGEEIHLFGLVFDRKFNEELIKEQMSIEGLLHSAMNKYVAVLQKTAMDFVTQKFEPLKFIDVRKEISDILHKLRQETLELMSK